MAAQNLLFTFRCNGQNTKGEPLAEVLVEQLADYDPKAGDEACNKSWSGTEANLSVLLEELGFATFDIQGVLGALHDHRGADRRLAVSQASLDEHGFANAE